MDAQLIAHGASLDDATVPAVRGGPSSSRSLGTSSLSSDSYCDDIEQKLALASQGYSSRCAIDWHNYYQWGWDTIWDFSPPRSRYDLFPLPKSLSSRIPIEVVEAVIDYIEWQSLLCTCALVCRSWYYRSTMKLYRRIAITSRIDFDRLSTSARQSQRVRDRLALTRHIDIRSSAQAFPLVFGKLLPRLETLELGEACMTPPIHRSFFLALSQLASITSLTMFGLELFNFIELRNIISRFPLLTKLSIIDVSCKHVPADRITANTVRPSTPQSNMRLRELVIRGAWAATLREIIDWLTANSPTCELVSRLTVRGTVGEGTRHFQQLLQVSGRSLIDCQLDFKLGGESNRCPFCASAQEGSPACRQITLTSDPTLSSKPCIWSATTL
ncbi:hypothetical protein FOMPIDRAFT_1128948 [Fomitopsis schrenkii]|uniref:Uncharacterized protein n=1 Tax=Fomitopsis schrenkii TaxID=2126942 RepID=S8FFR1_FOMSC|nr:hypothetical protein FOMPIDRAFT_1128948 [Fomitopsis schrenkii]